MAARDDLRAFHTSADNTCIVNRCAVGGCRIALPRSAICINCDVCDAFPGNTTRPDFIIFDQAAPDAPPVWTIVEMKGRLDDPHGILRQIQSGAATIESHPLFQIGDSPTRNLRPIVLFSGHSHAADFQRFDRKPITFFGRRFVVRALRCRTPLALADL